jgi:hypothetical protein
VSTSDSPSKDIDDRLEARSLLQNLKEALPSLQVLLQQCNDHWGYEDGVYRFYHQSFKVYDLQDTTLQIVAALQALAPERKLNDWFVQIVNEGTGRKFEMKHNDQWLTITRPILEAFFHARYFLEMGVRYGGTLEAPPRWMPSGWAAFLYLYDLR